VPVSLPSTRLRPLSNAELSEGTGGTIAGTGQFLKSMADDILVVLADPEGSGLYNKVNQVAVIIIVIDTALIIT
jgi:cysteine synthase